MGGRPRAQSGRCAQCATDRVLPTDDPEGVAGEAERVICGQCSAEGVCASVPGGQSVSATVPVGSISRGSAKAGDEPAGYSGDADRRGR